MMDSPEPSNINNNTSSLSSSTLNSNTPSSQSPQVQESPFLRFANSLSPIKHVKATHVAQPHGFLGLNSPPLVFKSPRISAHHLRETQCSERPEGSHLSSGDISQSGIRDNSHGEAPGDLDKLIAQQPISEVFITDAGKDIDANNDVNAQSCSPPTSVDEYLADPGDDQMYADNPEMGKSTDGVESSLTDGPSNRAEELLPLLEESNIGHQERPAQVVNPAIIEGEKNVTEQRHHCAPQLMPGPIQDVKECGNCNEKVSSSQVNRENIPQDDSEASIKYHGIRRRCLQFEEAASIALGSNKSHVKLIPTSSNMKVVPVTVSKPPGIGLHLNSIIKAMPPSCASTTGVRLSDGLQGIQSKPSISLHKVESVPRSSIPSNMDGQPFIDTRNESHENTTDSLISKSPILPEAIDLYPCDKRKVSPTDTENTEEFNLPSTSKKKKKTNTDDVGGPKRCNCKKSKCLKLYCDCFGAGIFCGDGCACESCGNRIEFQDTVVETKHHIESRNPQAFAPKIVLSVTDVPLNNVEDVNMTTPASARHKRGCNCKRSMCTKKYCECFQANVGCSSGCRCEGCKNAFGKREDYVAIEHASSKERESSIIEEVLDDKLHNKQKMVTIRTDLVRPANHLSPVTPLLQYSDQGKRAAKSRLISASWTKSSKKTRSSLAHTESNDSRKNVPTRASSKENEWIDVAAYQLSNRSGIRQLSGDSLRQHSSSPFSPSTNLDGEPDGKLFDILEDETPDALKEASTPIKTVKANSPIQKRISPPKSHLLRIGSSSSGGGLKSGRKFILQSVPSFPPLTPCAESKVTHNTNEDSDNSGKKVT